MKKLEGKIASGIGRARAKVFHAEGAASSRRQKNSATLEK
jgi:hypothetical protein